MSGFGPSQLNIIPVTSGVIPGPNEGSKIVVSSINWSILNPANGITQINLLQQFQSAQFLNCQAIYVDNSQCPYTLQIVCNQTEEQITVPPYSQGMYPIAVSTAPSFTLTLINFLPDPVSGTLYQNFALTNLYFYNTAQVPYINSFNYGALAAQTNNALLLIQNLRMQNLNPALPTPPANSAYKYVYFGFDLTIVANVAPAANTFVSFGLFETNGSATNTAVPGSANYLRFSGAFISPSNTAGQVYQIVKTYSPPLTTAQVFGGSNLAIAFNNLPTGSNYYVAANISYGIVEIGL